MIFNKLKKILLFYKLNNIYSMPFVGKLIKIFLFKKYFHRGNKVNQSKYIFLTFVKKKSYYRESNNLSILIY